jgi:surface antigen
MIVVVMLAAALSACASSPSPPPTRAALLNYSSNDDAPELVKTSTPQSCAVYARERSGIALYGDAYTWWDQARGRYQEVSQPLAGSVMVLTGYAGPKHGHVALVTRIVSSREIRVDHANWLNDGNVYLNTPVIDVSAANDWSEVRLWNTRDGHLGSSTYRVQGFISSLRVAAS